MRRFIKSHCMNFRVWLAMSTWLLAGKYRVLIDTGSGFGDSNQELEKGLEEISQIYEEKIVHLIR